MPGTTTRLKLPYPLPTEPVANGATAIRALADAMDTIIPMKFAVGAGGYTTNQYGGITVTVAGLIAGGVVAICQQPGYACNSSNAAAPAGQAYINIFSTSNGAVVPNTFIIINFIVFGT